MGISSERRTAQRTAQGHPY